MQDVQRAVGAIAKSKHRDWSLWVALIDPRAACTVSRAKEREKAALLGRRSRAAERSRGMASRGGNRSPARTHWAGSRAPGRGTFLAADLAEFMSLYELAGKLQSMQPNWAHLLIEWLSAPHIAGVLLFVAWFALLMEISQPGLSVAGFVSVLCFVVYFWSQFLHGTAGWLEVLLFVVGVVSVLVEIFVIPGIGIFGLGGGLLIIVSIILASQTFVIPRNSYQLEQLPGSLLMVAAAGSGAVSRHGGHAPLLGRSAVVEAVDVALTRRGRPAATGPPRGARGLRLLARRERAGGDSVGTSRQGSVRRPGGGCHQQR